MAYVEGSNLNIYKWVNDWVNNLNVNWQDINDKCKCKFVTELVKCLKWCILMSCTSWSRPRTCPHARMDFSGALEQFSLEDVPDGTNNTVDLGSSWTSVPVAVYHISNWKTAVSLIKSLFRSTWESCHSSLAWLYKIYCILSTVSDRPISVETYCTNI